MEDLPGTYERLKTVESGVTVVGRNLDGLVAKLEQREQETQKARQDAQKERKSDRRWLIGTGAVVVTVLRGLF